MSADEYVPSDEELVDGYRRKKVTLNGWTYHPVLSRAEIRRGLARVRRDAALHEKQRIAGEVRIWASVNDDLKKPDQAELLRALARDIDRIPEETP